MEDVHNIIETLIQELKNSGYNRKYSREIVVSGILGWKRKIARRIQEGKPFYRSAPSTLAQRCRKKLTEKTSCPSIRIKEKEKMMQMEGRTRRCVQQAEIEPAKLNNATYCRGGADWTLPRQSL